jgi:hypothetical protein
MLRTTHRRKFGGKKAFTLFEALTASSITVFIVLGVWSIYVLGWSQWHEIEPQLDAQKIARSALAAIVEGSQDSTADTYVIGSSTYFRRNGIAQATAIPDLPTPQRINFRLEPDSSNIRSFYLGVDYISGLNVVCYKDRNNAVHAIGSTLGITNIIFEKYGGNDNLIKVTATVERDVFGTRAQTYHISVLYSDVAYLRSVSN